MQETLSTHTCISIYVLRFLQDPTSQFLHWKHCPENVLVIKKVNDVEVTENAKQLARWLVEVN